MNDQHGPDAPVKAGSVLAQIAAKLLSHRVLGGAFALRGIGILAGLALTFLLGRYMGAAATGTYALVTQTTTFLAALGLIGLDLSVVRHFSKSIATRRPVAVSVFVRVIGACAGLLAAIALVMVLGGDLVWQGLFGDVVGRELIALVCVTLLARGMIQILGGFLRSQNRIAIGIAMGVVIMPVTAAGALLTGLAETVEQVLWATALGGIACVVWGLWASIRYISTDPDAITVPMRTVLASSLPLWGAALTLVLGEWYALAVTARMLSVADAGVFRVGTQIAGALSVVSGTITSVYLPQISSAFHADDRNGAARLARTTVRVTVALALPIAIVLIAATPFLLPLIGPEFVAAMPVVVTLVIGQFLIALSGPCGFVLAMSGNEKINLAISIVGTGLLLVIAPLAAVAGGIHGVAIAVSAVLVSRNVAAYFYLRFKLGIEVWSGRALTP